MMTAEKPNYKTMMTAEEDNAQSTCTTTSQSQASTTEKTSNSNPNSAKAKNASRPGDKGSVAAKRSCVFKAPDRVAIQRSDDEYVLKGLWGKVVSHSKRKGTYRVRIDKKQIGQFGDKLVLDAGGKNYDLIKKHYWSIHTFVPNNSVLKTIFPTVRKSLMGFGRSWEVEVTPGKANHLELRRIVPVDLDIENHNGHTENLTGVVTGNKVEVKLPNSMSHFHCLTESYVVVKCTVGHTSWRFKKWLLETEASFEIEVDAEDASKLDLIQVTLRKK